MGKNKSMLNSPYFPLTCNEIHVDLFEVNVSIITNYDLSVDLLYYSLLIQGRLNFS
jgi:hypothetical protein